MKEAGGDVIGLDWRVELGADVGAARPRRGGAGQPRSRRAPVGHRRDPPRGARTSSTAVAGRPGHIFNLGHGVHQETPVDHVKALVDIVHELSAR